MLNRRQVCCAWLAIWVAGQAVAESDETVVLTVSGLGERIEYTMSDLIELGSSTFETTTIWSDGVQTFTGVPLVSLINDLGIGEGRLLAQAINDYAVEIPLSDSVEGGPMLAYELNGEPMSIRDKGPLWLVYPYDQNPEYRSEVIYSRSIWHLDRIEVLP